MNYIGGEYFTFETVTGMEPSVFGFLALIFCISIFISSLITGLNLKLFGATSG